MRQLRIVFTGSGIAATCGYTLHNKVSHKIEKPNRTPSETRRFEWRWLGNPSRQGRQDLAAGSSALRRERWTGEGARV